MNPHRHIRIWSAVASAAAQISATAAGMLPWWALPITLGLTASVSRSDGPINPQRVRLTRGAGVAGVGLFAGLIAFKTVAAGSEGADPITTLRSLTEALVILSLVMAPSARTPREYRVWLTVTTGVLVAAAAGGHSAISAALSMISWIVLLTAITKVQTAAAVVDGAVVATTVDGSNRLSRGRDLGHLATMVPVGAALIAGALVFFALPSGLGGKGLANKIASHVNGKPPVEAGSRDTLGIDTFGGGDLNLDLRGSLADTPIMRVPSHSPTLWRGTFYSVYTGQGWLASNNQLFIIRHGTNLKVPTSPYDPPATGSHTHTYRAIPVAGFHTSLLWSPGVPTHVKLKGGSLDGISRQPSNVRITSGLGVMSYDVTARVAPTSPTRLSKSTGADPTDAQWTQLPSELPSDVSALAHQITANAQNRVEAVTDIESYLRSHETYSLNSPVPASGQDAVAEFLFRDHTGFCEQFASAEAVMLRTLNIPARVVTGLAYGTPEGAERLYTEANSHAWDEVYYPGIGWSPSDPTAGATLAPATTSHQGWLSRLINGLTSNLPGGKSALMLIVLLLAAGAAFAGRVLFDNRRSVERRDRSPRPQPGPVLTAFQRLTASPRAPAPKAPAETAREYLARITPPGSLDDAVQTLEQECYGAGPVAPSATEAAVQSFADLAAGLKN